MELIIVLSAVVLLMVCKWDLTDATQFERKERGLSFKGAPGLYY